MKLKTLLNCMDNGQYVTLASSKNIKVTVGEIKEDKLILETKVINILLINNELTIFIK